MGPARRRSTLRSDESGAFPVLEAILVAVLVLTAILFFTSVQRPSRGAEQGGIDLGQVAADTLQILRTHAFTASPCIAPATSPCPQTLEGWMTNLTNGDPGTSAVVDSFVKQVLPSGARYALRLDNGVGNLTLLGSGLGEAPFGARAAEVVILPNWATYRNESTSTFTSAISPGQVLDSSDAAYPLVDPTSSAWQCYRAPDASSTGPDGRDADTTADTWASHWKTAPASTVLFKSVAGQVPRDLPMGRWRVYAAADCTGTPQIVKVVPAGTRIVTDATVTSGSAVVTSPTATFTIADLGRQVTCTAPCILPFGDRILQINSATSVNLAVAATGSSVGATAVLSITPDPTFTPYGLQLVVWFGA